MQTAAAAARVTAHVMPTTCVSAEPLLCTQTAYSKDAWPGTPLPVGDMVDPIVHLKLELAGYTLADARTLQLVSTERTDTIENSAVSTQIENVPTVAELRERDRVAAAGSLGFTVVLRSTVHVVRSTSSASMRWCTCAPHGWRPGRSGRSRSCASYVRTTRR